MQTLLENKQNMKLRTKISYLKSANDIILNKENKEYIKNFHDFCKMFFSLWDEYLERVGPLILEFNSKKSSISFKKIYAEIIAEQYGKYLNDLTSLEVPIFMNNSFNLFLNSLKYKRIFYNLFSTDPENKNLDNIKNESSFVEEQFWLDIYRENLEIEGQLND